MSNELALPSVTFTPAVLTPLNEAVAKAQALEDITNVPTCEAAVAVSVELSRAIKGVAEERLAFTRKIDAVKTKAMAHEREVTKEAVEALTIIDAEVKKYDDMLKQERVLRENAAKAQEAALRAHEAETGATSEHVTAPLVVAEPVLEQPQIATRRVPRLVIVDAAAVPRDYLLIDEKRALADLKAGKTIAGLQLGYEDVRVHR